MSNTNKSTWDEEWENRKLCPDGGCIGVVGPDGRCKECGLAAEPGAGPAVPEADESEDERIEDFSDEPNGGDAFGPDEASFPESEWEARTLCTDENCIGVIGSDGFCKECGKPLEG